MAEWVWKPRSTTTVEEFKSYISQGYTLHSVSGAPVFGAPPDVSGTYVRLVSPTNVGQNYKYVIVGFPIKQGIGETEYRQYREEISQRQYIPQPSDLPERRPSASEYNTAVVERQKRIEKLSAQQQKFYAPSKPVLTLEREGVVSPITKGMPTTQERGAYYQTYRETLPSGQVLKGKQFIPPPIVTLAPQQPSAIKVERPSAITEKPSEKQQIITEGTAEGYQWKTLQQQEEPSALFKSLYATTPPSSETFKAFNIMPTIFPETIIEKGTAYKKGEIEKTFAFNEQGYTVTAKYGTFDKDFKTWSQKLKTQASKAWGEKKYLTGAVKATVGGAVGFIEPFIYTMKEPFVKVTPYGAYKEITKESTTKVPDEIKDISDVHKTMDISGGLKSLRKNLVFAQTYWAHEAQEKTKDFGKQTMAVSPFSGRKVAETRFSLLEPKFEKEFGKPISEVYKEVKPVYEAKRVAEVGYTSETASLLAQESAFTVGAFAGAPPVIKGVGSAVSKVLLKKVVTSKITGFIAPTVIIGAVEAPTIVKESVEYGIPTAVLASTGRIASYATIFKGPEIARREYSILRLPPEQKVVARDIMKLTKLSAGQKSSMEEGIKLGEIKYAQPIQKEVAQVFKEKPESVVFGSAVYTGQMPKQYLFPTKVFPTKVSKGFLGITLKGIKQPKTFPVPQYRVQRGELADTDVFALESEAFVKRAGELTKGKGYLPSKKNVGLLETPEGHHALDVHEFGAKVFDEVEVPPGLVSSPWGKPLDVIDKEGIKQVRLWQQSQAKAQSITITKNLPAKNVFERVFPRKELGPEPHRISKDISDYIDTQRQLLKSGVLETEKMSKYNPLKYVKESKLKRQETALSRIEESKFVKENIGLKTDVVKAQKENLASFQRGQASLRSMGYLGGVSRVASLGLPRVSSGVGYVSKSSVLPSPSKIASSLSAEYKPSEPSPSGKPKPSLPSPSPEEPSPSVPSPSYPYKYPSPSPSSYYPSPSVSSPIPPKYPPFPVHAPAFGAGFGKWGYREGKQKARYSPSLSGQMFMKPVARAPRTTGLEMRPMVKKKKKFAVFSSIWDGKGFKKVKGSKVKKLFFGG